MGESDIYNSIKSTTYVLYNLYQRLTKLEIEGKNSSKEYEETLRTIEIYTALEDKTLKECVQMAADLIDSGKALAKMQEFVEATQKYA